MQQTDKMAQHSNATGQQQQSIKSLARKVLERNTVARQGCDTVPDEVLQGGATQSDLLQQQKHTPAMDLLANLEGEEIYRQRAECVLQKMCEDYEPGTILWLEGNAPLLYSTLTASLPNRVSELWNARAPLAEFDAVLAELLEMHRSAVVRCRAARKVIHK